MNSKRYVKLIKHVLIYSPKFILTELLKIIMRCS